MPLEQLRLKKGIRITFLENLLLLTIQEEHLLHGKRNQTQPLDQILALEQIVQIITTTQGHTTLRSLTIVTLGLQLLNLAIIELVDLHQLTSLQEVVVIVEIEAVLDHQGQEVHHLQVAQAEVAAVLPEVKEVVHRLNQEEEDKPVY